MPVEIEANSANTSDEIIETTAQAVNAAGSDHPSEKESPLSRAGDETRPSPVDQANVALNPVAVLEHEEPEKSRTSLWVVAVLLVILAVLLSVSIGSFNKETELKDEVKNRMAEVERMKQDMERMQREREAALEKVRLEQQQRAEAEQAAVEAANKERAAMAAAELAAEEALQATKKAEDLAKKQRLEERKLRDERKRIELEKKQAEREWQRLMLERKQAKLEQQRLELEKAKTEELAQ